MPNRAATMSDSDISPLRDDRLHRRSRTRSPVRITVTGPRGWSDGVFVAPLAYGAAGAAALVVGAASSAGAGSGASGSGSPGAAWASG